LTLLGAMFGRAGANVISASSAHEALNWARSNRPHIIVSDIGMPDTDGYQMLAKLRQLPGLNSVPAIAISGYASDEDRRQALSVGYCALIPKPIDVDLLFDLLNDLNLNPIK